MDNTHCYKMLYFTFTKVADPKPSRSACPPAPQLAQEIVPSHVVVCQFSLRSSACLMSILVRKSLCLEDEALDSQRNVSCRVPIRFRWTLCYNFNLGLPRNISEVIAKHC